MNKEKIKEFAKDNAESIGAGLAGAAIAGVSYAIGVGVTKSKYTVALNAVTLVDPEIKTRIIEATKVIKDRIG